MTRSYAASCRSSTSASAWDPACLPKLLGEVGDPAHANDCVYWVMYDKSEAYPLLLDCSPAYDGNMRFMRGEGGELRMVGMA